MTAPLTAPHTASPPQASRATEELYNAIVKNDLTAVYEKVEEGADVNFVFGAAYGSPEGYTPLMVAGHRGRLECAQALLRAGMPALCMCVFGPPGGGGGR
jgi:hypothetical protein